MPQANPPLPGYSVTDAAPFTPAVSPVVTITGAAGIQGATRISKALYDVVPGQATPTYVGSDGSAFASYGLKLIEYTGADRNNLASRVITNFGVGAKDALGAAIGSNVSIHGCKVLSDGAVLVHVFNGTTNCNHLYLTKTTRAFSGTDAVPTAFGSDAGRSNAQAVLDIGYRSGAANANIRTTTIKSIGETTNFRGEKHVWLVEYNVATGRTAGGANDFVRILRSSDMGLTWSTFIEMNTTVSEHFADHLHGVVQNPYTGTIYFMAGDGYNATLENDERWILAYDGVSAAPALGSGPAVFAATPGWKLIQGSELYRTCDILFSKTTAYWLPDVDTESIDTASKGFGALVADPMLSWVSRTQNIERIDNLPPVLGCRTASGISVFVSFKNANPAENAYWIWTSGDDGLTWRLAGKIRGYLTIGSIGVPWSFYEDPYNPGTVILSGGYAKGVQWTPISENASSYILAVCGHEAPALTYG